MGDADWIGAYRVALTALQQEERDFSPLTRSACSSAPGTRCLLNSRCNNMEQKIQPTNGAPQPPMLQTANANKQRLVPFNEHQRETVIRAFQADR